MLHKLISVLASVSVLALAASPAAAQQRLAGTWQGYWTRAGDTLVVTMTLQKDTIPGRYVGTFDADRLRVSGIPFNDVQLRNCCEVTQTLRGDRSTYIFTGKLRGDSLVGTFQEGNSGGQFAYKRARAAAPLFEERDIKFTNDSITLAGSLLRPMKGAALAAVVFLHGSGGEGRWASRFLAAQLARNGIAALIYDKRGVGGSSGDWRQASLEDLASDAAAAVKFLRDQPRIDRTRVGIHGHSQGGTLAPFIAARANGVAFIVASAAAGTPTDSTEIYSILNSIYANAKSAVDSANARTYVSELVDVAYQGQPRARLDSLVNTMHDRPWYFAPPAADNSYWSFSKLYAAYHPLEWWTRVQVPVLLVYGAADQRVPAAESAARIAATLLRAGNHDVSVRTFPGADHTFRLAPGPGGWPVTAPHYISSLLDWLAHR